MQRTGFGQRHSTGEDAALAMKFLQRQGISGQVGRGPASQWACGGCGDAIADPEKSHGMQPLQEPQLLQPGVPKKELEAAQEDV